MADGSRIRSDVAAPGPCLRQAAGGRSTLWARCRCGGAAVLDPAPWQAQGLGRLPLIELEDRLRCRCGARRVRLEIRGLAEAPPGARGGIFIFR